MKFRGSTDNIPSARAVAIGVNAESDEVIIALISRELPLGGIVLDRDEFCQFIRDAVGVAREIGISLEGIGVVH